jgi:hypothetical protein
MFEGLWKYGKVFTSVLLTAHLPYRCMPINSFCVVHVPNLVYLDVGSASAYVAALTRKAIIQAF